MNSKKALPPKYGYRLEGMFLFRDALVSSLDPINLVCSCVTCNHFADDETCKLTDPPMRPPAKVIAFGCPSYDDDIPF